MNTTPPQRATKAQDSSLTDYVAGFVGSTKIT